MSSQLVKLPSGISLEIELAIPVSSGSDVLAVCLHPWSWLGGRKDDPVLQFIEHHMRQKNYSVLRYNSRSVGRSTGWASFTGFSESKDLEDLVTWALEKMPTVKSLVLIGYSYGSLIASLHPVLPGIKTSHVLISYPLGPRGWLTMFRSGTYNAKLQELIRRSDSNVFIIYGDQDEFTSASNYRTWRENVEKEAGEGRLKIIEVARASHFWRGSAADHLWDELGGWPLPDERPRQSVANLIGRFENQVKRQPSSSPGSARSSSVVSHTTGDSAKEEAKEKREWPPKSVTPQERPPPIVPSSSWSRSQAAAAQPSTQPDQTSAATQADITEEDSSVTPRANSAISIDVGKVPQGQLSIGVTAPTPTSSNTPTTAKPLSKGPQVKPHAPRPSLPAVPKTPARTAPRASTHHPPIAQPLKPQHTGPAALPSVRKVTPKTVTAPTTPARSKTPSRPVSSAASRPKTPSSTRSKTPSSGLFAPTAASLARARSAQPLPPTPSKKATLSSTVAERLSKPTAASLSRARSPTAVPARGGAKASPARGGAAPRGAAKPRPSATTTRVKGNAAAAAKTSVAAAATAASAVNVGIVAVTDESLSQGNGHLDDDAVDSHDEALPDTSHSDVDTEAKENQAGHATEAAEIFVAKSPELVAEPELDVPEEQQGTPSIDERRDEVKSRVPRDDIEDMVNLLESAPISKPRPDSIYSIPDEVSEIPDEE